VSSHWKPERTKVELKPAPRPSRIRRDPPPAEKPESLDKAMWRQTHEWEIALAVIGMIFFALGVDAMVYLIAGWLTP
jgi:hypothetical protein